MKVSRVRTMPITTFSALPLLRICSPQSELFAISIRKLGEPEGKSPSDPDAAAAATTASPASCAILMRRGTKASEISMLVLAVPGSVKCSSIMKDLILLSVLSALPVPVPLESPSTMMRAFYPWTLQAHLVTKLTDVR